MIELTDERVPLRDGVRLALDVVCPPGGGPWPVVLVRTPYDKVDVRAANAALYERLLASGYAVAVNDCRGRFASEGTFDPYVHEADDGYDVVEWVAAQDWCDGGVGMVGASYAGQTQWYAASRKPPHLRAIVPIVSPPGSPWANEPILGGVPLLVMAEWMVEMGERSWRVGPFTPDSFARPLPYLDTLPLTDIPAAAGTASAWWQEMMRHPDPDGYWVARGYDPALAEVPALNVTGWWDMNFPGAPTNFAAHGGRLLVGPWPHRVNRTEELSGLRFPGGVIDLDAMIVAFFDEHLRGLDVPPAPDETAVRVYVVGSGWRTAASWPLPGTEFVPFHLNPGGALERDRSLAGSTAFVHDPADPVRSVWRMDEGPVDDAELLARADVACWTTAPLTGPLDVVGPVRCVLRASSTAPDTDWHVRLYAVEPDGTSRFLCHGAVRARHRTSPPRLLDPGEVAEYDIAMDAAGMRFPAGHRIRVAVASSWFPRFARNPGGGSANPNLESDPVRADQAVHDGSSVLLPVVPRGRGSS